MGGKKTWKRFGAWMLTFAMVFSNSSFASLAEDVEIFVVDEDTGTALDEGGSWQGDILSSDDIIDEDSTGEPETADGGYPESRRMIPL